jgi:Carboxypeptidase regulatory-like domain
MVPFLRSKRKFRPKAESLAGMRRIMRSSRNWVGELFILVVCVFLSALPLLGADVTAALSGTVKDASGAVVSGATITLTNTQTNISRTLKTGSDGSYSFTLVPVGNYKLTVEQTGFRKYVQDGIVLQVSQAAKQDVTLKIGAPSEVIEVTENVAQVDTVSATLGSVETQKRIVDLPLVERDTFQLGKLQAGVLENASDDGSGNPFSVSGQRSESLSFLLDGVDNNDFLGNNAVVDPNPDAVQEFKILTNNYGAEYGRSSGGIINQVLKSGSNALHGTLFEFFRNEDLNANGYFLKSAALPRTRFNRNIFGGSLGGPIRKDKTFFFLSYQGKRRIEGQVAPVLQVLSPAERGCSSPTPGCVGTVADFREVLTGQIDPTTGFDTGQLFDPNTGNPYVTPSGVPNQVPINPVIGTYISKYLPLPNVPDSNNFAANPIGRIQEDQGIVRIDHHFSDRDLIYGNYVVNDAREAFPFRIVNGASSGGNVPLGSGFSDLTRSQQGAVTWVHTFSPSVVNEFIFGANRRAGLQAVPADTTSPSALGFKNVNPDDAAGGAPPIMFSNTFQLGPSPQGPTKEHDVTFHWQDNFSWHKGHHDMKFGADIRRVRNNFNFDFFNNGSFDFANFVTPFTGDPFADFVGGFPDNYFQFSNASYGIRTSSLHFYGQDSWKITPRLTLDFGLRYEYNTPQYDPHNEIIGFFPGQQSTKFPDAPNSLLYPGDPGTPNRGMVFPDRNNFAPRFGFAWDVFGNAKLVMRSGFGIFYDIEDGALNLQFGGQPPFGDVTNLNYSGFTPGVDPIADPFNAFAQGTVNPFPFIAGGRLGQFFVPKVSFAYVVDPHFRTPYSENYNFGLQYQLTKDTLVEAYYVGSLGRKLITTADVNFPQPSILLAQFLNPANADLTNGIVSTNADCARPLAGCADPTLASSSLTNAGQLLTDHSNGLSDSHQLQVTVDKRFSGGFNLRSAYTFSKTIDIQSGFRTRSSLQTDPLNIRLDRGLADFDATHRLVLSGSWEIPWDKPFRQGNHFLHKLTEGWQLNGIAAFQSGNPFTIFSDDNQSLQASFLERADLVGKPQTFNPRTIRTFSPDPNGLNGSCLNGPTTGNFYFNPLAYNCISEADFLPGTAPPGVIPLLTFGNSGRNSIRGPGINNVDLSIFKNIKFSERTNLQFRTEFFNAFNHTQFVISGNSATASGFHGNFGQVTQTRDPRIIQFALKLSF